MKKKDKFLSFLGQLVQPWEIIPLVTIFVLNLFIYGGSAFLTQDRFHYDLTTAIDRMVPLISSFSWIYVLAFPFWGLSYILSARRGKDIFYRFVATDLTIHALCFIIFIILPTTNVRPVIPDEGLSNRLLGLIYELDGGSQPSNLFPSIHCYVSWLCYRGLKGAKEIPRAYQRFAGIFAVLIIISTQVLKQHYLVDAVAAVVLVEVFWRFYQKKDRSAWARNLFETVNGAVWKKS